MRNLILILALLAGGLTVACSGSDNSAGKSAQSGGDSGSTSLSIDTDKNSMSFKKSHGGGGTSVNINSGDKKDQ